MVWHNTLAVKTLSCGQEGVKESPAQSFTHKKGRMNSVHTAKAELRVKLVIQTKSFSTIEYHLLASKKKKKNPIGSKDLNRLLYFPHSQREVN